MGIVNNHIKVLSHIHNFHPSLDRLDSAAEGKHFLRCNSGDLYHSQGSGHEVLHIEEPRYVDAAWIGLSFIHKLKAGAAVVGLYICRIDVKIFGRTWVQCIAVDRHLGNLGEMGCKPVGCIHDVEDAGLSEQVGLIVGIFFYGSVELKMLMGDVGEYSGLVLHVDKAHGAFRKAVGCGFQGSVPAPLLHHFVQYHHDFGGFRGGLPVWVLGYRIAVGVGYSGEEPGLLSQPVQHLVEEVDGRALSVGAGYTYHLEL